MRVAILPNTHCAARNLHNRSMLMNEQTLENFKKLSPEMKEKIIAFLLKMLTDYRLLFSDLDSVANSNS